jgi:hypothetical protein
MRSAPLIRPASRGDTFLWFGTVPLDQKTSMPVRQLLRRALAASLATPLAAALALPVAAATLGAQGAAQAAAPSDASWMRYPAISPDGQSIVFTYKGDLWRVATAGGAATQLTQHVAHD